METETYRFNRQTGEVYIYDEGQRAYLFCGCLNGRSPAQFVAEVEKEENIWWQSVKNIEFDLDE